MILLSHSKTNDGVADSTLTLRGTVDDINTALRWVVYRPANVEENFYQWTVEEGGNWSLV
jgi:hypothetical protein